MHFGKIAVPASISFKGDGVVFFVFTSEPGFEQLMIGKAKPDKKSVPVGKTYSDNGVLSRCFIPLNIKMDKKEPPAPYYMSVVRDDDLELDLENGYIFFVFTAKPGKEQLQIVRNTPFERENYRNEAAADFD